MPLPPDEPIAAVGLSCRVPGAADPEAFWRLLMDGVDAIREVPAERWPIGRLFDPDPARPGRMSTRFGGFLDGVDRFDAAFFGISPREAAQMDPQQRLALELAWEAFEDAGWRPSLLAGRRAGVFLGTMWSDYARLLAGPEGIVQHTATGQDTSIISARISYALGLEGPSLTVNTACSSALVAVHLACQSLRSGESELALAGGVHLVLAPESTIAMTKFGAMAPDGRCKAFDARANGYVRGEGGGLVALKPLSRAEADGDRIYAVILGSAVNNDGPSNGLTAPNPDAQRAMLEDALAAARLSPDSIDYVEAHGTGTALGDPIEAGALGAVLGRDRPPSARLRIGSVKTNIGHLEAAAGAAGLIKTVLALDRRRLPPSLHFQTPSPHIAFDALGLQVQDRAEPWPDRP
ncbi:type I polyketide synthase, partial [Geminicoccus harenae]|uniref:type I polyketide synthase n=1 Tax=Geminicoccus harenae TaxID=2498453 RepID=UPI00168A7F88